MQNAFRVFGLALSPLAITLLAGCNGLSPLVERRVTLEFPPAAGAPVEIRTANGGISLGQGDPDKVVVNAVIKARTQERADATIVTATVDTNGTLVIAPQWPGERMGNEGCSLDVLASYSGAFVLDSSNGAISVNGVSGSMRASTSNGSIKISAFTGPLDTSTSNGSVTIVGATEGVAVRTSNGGVKVSLGATAPGPVAITTSNGSINLEVGAGFAGSLSATTSNGSVSIGAPNASDVRVSKGKGSATFGPAGAGAPSTLTSSNGSIVVRGG